MNFLHPYLHAVQRFTRLRATAILAPAPGAGTGLQEADTAHFPGVGWLVGLAACVVFAAFAVLLPDSAYAPLVAAVASTAATLLLTGGVHESGLAAVTDEKTLTLTLLAKVALLALLAAQAPVAVLFQEMQRPVAVVRMQRVHQVKCARRCRAQHPRTALPGVGADG